jgi:hypothetical protein
MIIKTNKKFIRKKLKKKWRFWRLYKLFFLRQKKKNFFCKIKWLFNEKRIIWHQLSQIYGKKIKHIIYANHCSKKIFNSKFDSLLVKLELRLNIILFRINFLKKLLFVNSLKNLFFVNGSIKHINYQVCSNDLIYNTNINGFFFGKLKNCLSFSFWKWRKFRRKYKKQIRQFFKSQNRYRVYFLFQQNIVFNFVEINYFIYSSILIRFPLLGEIIYKNKKRFLFSGLLQKIHYLY